MGERQRRKAETGSKVQLLLEAGGFSLKSLYPSQIGNVDPVFPLEAKEEKVRIGATRAKCISGLAVDQACNTLGPLRAHPPVTGHNSHGKVHTTGTGVTVTRDFVYRPVLLRMQTPPSCFATHDLPLDFSFCFFPRLFLSPFHKTEEEY